MAPLSPSSSPQPPATLYTPSRRIPTGYRVVRVYDHDVKCFTQGLLWRDDPAAGTSELYEGFGLYGQSGVRRVTLTPAAAAGGMGSYAVTAETRIIESRYFGEGITLWDDTLYQLTWKERTAIKYDAATLERIGTVAYRTTSDNERSDEGWGLTHNGSHMLVTDGTARVSFWDPATLRTVATLPVTDASTHEPVTQLNEIEYIHGWLFANVWYRSYIGIIDPVSGDMVARLEMGPLRTFAGGDVLNGIAYSMRLGPQPGDPWATQEWGGRLWVTGKWWPRMYELELTDFVDAPPTRADNREAAARRRRRAAAAAAAAPIR